jgi:hypothetical protein
MVKVLVMLNRLFLALILWGPNKDGSIEDHGLSEVPKVMYRLLAMHFFAHAHLQVHGPLITLPQVLHQRPQISFLY